MINKKQNIFVCGYRFWNWRRVISSTVLIAFINSIFSPAYAAISLEDKAKHHNRSGKLEDSELLSKNKYQPYLEIGGAKYFNQNSSAANLYDLFIPLFQTDDQLFFTDLRIFDRSGSSFEGNAHLGFRKLFADKQQMLGIYGAYDYKKSQYGNGFNQIMLGAEYWNNNWFFGGNIYKPIGTTKRLFKNEEIQVNKPDSRSIFNNKYFEKPLPGIDAEIGYAPIESFTVYGGGYYFHANNVATVAGPKIRITYNYTKPYGRILGILDGIGLEAGVQHDKPRGDTFYAGIKLKIGLTNSAKHTSILGFERHMTELVRRDPDIVVGAATPEIELADKQGYVLLDKNPQSQNLDDNNFSNGDNSDDTKHNNEYWEKLKKQPLSGWSIEDLSSYKELLLEKLGLEKNLLPAESKKIALEFLLAHHPDKHQHEQDKLKEHKVFIEQTELMLNLKHVSSQLIKKKTQPAETTGASNAQLLTDNRSISYTDPIANNFDKQEDGQNGIQKYNAILSSQQPQTPAINKYANNNSYKNLNSLSRITKEPLPQTASSIVAIKRYSNTNRARLLPIANDRNYFRKVPDNTIADAIPNTQNTIEPQEQFVIYKLIKNPDQLRYANSYIVNNAAVNDDESIWYKIIDLPIRLAQYFDQVVNAVIRTLIPIQPVQAGGPLYVLKKIGKEIGRILKQVFRVLNKAGINRAGIEVGFNHNGQPHIKETYFATPQGEKVRFYEKHEEDGSTTWSTKIGKPNNDAKVDVKAQKNKEHKQQDGSQKLYDEIYAKDTLFKAFNIVSQPEYEPQEGSYFWMLQQNAKYYTWHYPIQTMYQALGKDYDFPDNYYDYGYAQMVGDSYALGQSLAIKFSDYDSHILSYSSRSSIYLTENQKKELQQYEITKWDELIDDVARNLFNNGMWNIDETKNAFQEGFLSESKISNQALGSRYSDDYYKKRLDSITHNIQEEFKWQIEEGYSSLSKEVEKHLLQNLNENELNNALNIIKNNQFTSGLREAADQLLQMDSGEFETIPGKKSKLYHFEYGDMEYSFETSPDQTPQEFIQDFARPVDTVINDSKEGFEKFQEIFKNIANLDPKSFTEIIGSPIDFPTAKRKVVTNAILGGGLSLEACKVLCTSTTTATGGMIGSQLGAEAGVAGGPPGMLIGAAAGFAAGASMGFTTGRAACDATCVGLSQNAAASGGSSMLNNFDSEYAYYSKSTSGKNPQTKSQGTSGEKVFKHHVLSDKHHSKYTREFKKVTDKYDFELSKNPDNIVLMEKHSGPHPKPYHEWGLKKIGDISKEIEAQPALTQVQKNDLFRKLFKERVAKNAAEELIKETNAARAAKEAEKAAKEAAKAAKEAAKKAAKEDT